VDALQKPREHCQSSKGKCQKKIIKNDRKLEKHRLDYGRLQDGIKGVGERDMVDGMIGEEVDSLCTLCGYDCTALSRCLPYGLGDIHQNRPIHQGNRSTN